MNDNHDPLRRLSTRGTARGADDVLAAAEHGIARRRSVTRMALAGTAVVIIGLGIAMFRPSPAAEDTEIGPASESTVDPPNVPEPEPEPQPQPVERGEFPPDPSASIDPRCGGGQDLYAPDPARVAAAEAAFDGWLNTVPREDAAPFVQHWDVIGDAVLAAADAAPLPLDAYRGEVGALVNWGPEIMCFEYSILNDDIPVYSATGAAILVNEVWVVTRDTVCAAIEVGTVDCPLTEAEQDAGECPALVGAEPWLTLFEPSPYWACFRVAEFQRIHVWNKGFDDTTVVWPSGTLELSSDSFVVSEPAGDIFEPGPTDLEGAPYAVPTIWLVPAEDSPLFGLIVNDGSYGPISVGMTLDQANAAIGADFPKIVVDPNLLPGLPLWAAVFGGDPYSPIIQVTGTGDGSSTITEIIPADEW